MGCRPTAPIGPRQDHRKLLGRRIGESRVRRNGRPDFWAHRRVPRRTGNLPQANLLLSPSVVLRSSAFEILGSLISSPEQSRSSPELVANSSFWSSI
ncbi:unnamed protein product [Victoria cruziana]